MRKQGAPRFRLHDYRIGAFHITICAAGKARVFSSAADAALVRKSWFEIPGHFPDVKPETLAVLPDHLHGILILGPKNEAPLQVIVGSFKSAVTKLVRRRRGTVSLAVWQASFHDRILMGPKATETARAYVLRNPAKHASTTTEDPPQAET